MSSDGERIQKTSKSRRLIICDSDSSEDSIIIRNHRKRKTHQRVVSDGEGSDEDSDVQKPVSNKRKIHRLVSESETSCGSSDTEITGPNFNDSDTGSEWQSDWDSINESDNDVPSSNAKDEKKMKKINDGENESTSGAGFESDNSDGQSEKCPICLLPFRKQEIATPSSCEHCFCLECILEWSKNINTCPVDRQTFTVINVKSHTGKILRHIPIEVKQPLEDTIQEDPTFCEICGDCDREDRMLLCDGCDLGYHMECLQPQLFQVPLDEWFCSDCSQNMQNDAEAISRHDLRNFMRFSAIESVVGPRVHENMIDIDLDEVPDLIEEARRLGLSYGRTRGRHQIQNTFSPRIIPRTRQTERVRANIRAGRRNLSRETRARERRRLFDPDQPSTSSGIESIGENSRSRSPDINAPSTSSGRTKTTRRATTKKSKTSKSKTKKRNNTILREVRITEINDEGEEEEFVTYVKVKETTTSTSRKRKTKKRKVH